MRAFRRRSALPMAEAFDLGPAGQLAHTAKTWGTSVLATVASDGPAVRLSKRCSAMGYAAFRPAAACNSCYTRAVLWLIISIASLVIGFSAIYVILVIFFFRKLLRPPRQAAVHKAQGAARMSWLRARVK